MNVDSLPACQVGNLISIISKNSADGLRIVHLNIQSYFHHIDELRIDLRRQVPDIILISETWLKSWHLDGMLCIEGYKLVRNDRSDEKRGGGVGLLIKEGLKFNIILKSSFTERMSEFIIVEVVCESSKILVACVYNPHKSCSMSNFMECLEQLSSKYIEIVVGGDINLNLMDDADFKVRNFLLQVDSLGMSIVNTSSPTHFQGAPTLLDIFMVSKVDTVLQYQQLSAPGYSKHDLIFMVYAFCSSEITDNTFSFRDFGRINYEALRNDVIKTGWNAFLTLPLGSCVEAMEHQINNLYDLHVPIITRKRSSGSNQWMTREIMELRADRDKAFKLWKRSRLLADVDSYKEKFICIRNLTNSKIQVAKKEYYQRRLDPNLPTKDLWKNLKSIGVSSKTNDKCSIPPNELISSFFPAPQQTSLSAPTSSRSAPEFIFEAVSTVDVILAIASLKSTATGLDCVSLKFFKVILPLIITFFTDVINRCFLEGDFPSTWRRAKVIAVPKKSGNTFRPISLLPCLSKGVEKLAAIQITDHVHQHKLFNRFQSGFRKHHSCKTAVLQVYDDIRRSTDQNRIAILVLIDFSRAFDTVNHSLLLGKLKNRFGFSDCALLFVNSYLDNRKSIIFSNGSQSSEVSNPCGVPQGSILGPLFFCLYCEDMDSNFNHVNAHYYADDTQLYLDCAPEDFKRAIDRINSDLEKLTSWSTSNYLGINAKKSQCIVFSRKILDIESLPKVQINGECLSFVSKINNLGILMRSDLSWDDEIKKRSASVFVGLRQLWCLANVLPVQTKSLLAKSLLGHNFISSDVVMGELSYANLRRLQGAFNGMVRFVFNLRKFDHISHVSCELFGLPLKEYLRYRRQIFLFKLIMYKQPTYLFEKLSFFSSVRLRQNIHLERYNFLGSEKSFYVSDVIFWNQLPRSLKQCVSVDAFKSKLLVFMKQSVL